jgi:excinuclease ABC subunit A
LSIKSSHFSRQTQDGKCPHCEGSGEIVTVLDFLPDVSVPCDHCNGSGWNELTLKVTINGLNIWDVEQLDLSQLCDFLASQLPAKKLKELSPLFTFIEQTGLSQLSAGRPLKTLSGGELQRLKLVRGLSHIQGDHQLIMLDEPGAGLDPHDVLKLIELFRKLLNQGHTLVCATHDPLLAEAADRIIELGPGGGSMGGKIVSS